MARADLTMPESLLLLALHDETGERKGSYFGYALAGAALSELILEGRLVEAGDPPKRLEIVNTQPVGEPYLDACLDALNEKGSGKTARDYIGTLSGKSSLLHLLLDRLTARGAVSEKKARMLLFFTRTTYPEADPRLERALKQRLQSEIEDDGPVDARDGAIIALAHHIDILKHNFDRELLKARKDRIEAIAEGGLLPPHAARSAIKSAKAAVMIAAMVPVMVAGAN